MDFQKWNCISVFFADCAEIFVPRLSPSTKNRKRHIWLSINCGFIPYIASGRNQWDRAVLLGPQGRQESPACRARYSILELLQGTQEISAGRWTHWFSPVRWQFHPIDHAAFQSCPAAFKAYEQEDVPEGCRTDRGKLPDNRTSYSLRHSDAHPGKYDILPSSGTDISEQCSALMPATGTGSTTVP